MKIKEGIMTHCVGDRVYVLIKDASNQVRTKMFSMNETGGLIWNLLIKGCTENELVVEFTKTYNIDETAAKADITEMLTKMRDAGLLDD